MEAVYLVLIADAHGLVIRVGCEGRRRVSLPTVHQKMWFYGLGLFSPCGLGAYSFVEGSGFILRFRVQGSWCTTRNPASLRAFRVQGLELGVQGATRSSTTLSSEVNLHHAINFRALCGANVVTYPAKFRGIETRKSPSGGVSRPQEP